MNKFFSIANDTLNGKVDQDKLFEEIDVALFDGCTVKADVLTIHFVGDINETQEIALTAIINSHDGAPCSKSKIESLFDDYHQGFDFRDLDYTIKNLFPERTFIQGELQKVEWFSDEALTNKILIVDIVYTRDPYGFATSRDTVRTWVNSDDTNNPKTKITKKNYSPLEMIKEGKARRGNIVDGIQLPTMSFMLETMSEDPGIILLMGREFLDRHEDSFTRFIDNSSSVTDINDPNFGLKNIVVDLKNSALTTDTWLKNTPTALGGATIEQYLIGEFSI